MLTHNLPVHPTPFVGRQSELQEITRLLADSNCRLLTLLGPGGIGKTRLAVQVGHELTNTSSSSLSSLRPLQMQFRDGVYFVALQPLISSDFNLSALVDSLRIQLTPNVAVETQVLHFLRSKSLLLILDNFEHLLDGVGLISRILANAAGVKVLATSRTTLNLQEEWLLTLHGLEFPQVGIEVSEQVYDAMRLFELHTQRVRGNTSFLEERSAIGKICRLVEGMPLALELAAAWARSLTLDEIAVELGHGLDILESRSNNVIERHRTMRATLDYSWSLLSEKQQAVFKKLTVFRGGFTREAAEVVAGATRHTLAALVDHSWVRHEASGRYDIHELLRQYGEERLNEQPDEAEQAHDAHCSYFADFLANQFEHLKGAKVAQALRDIETELENVRMYWEWAVTHRRDSEIERGVASLWHFYDMGRFKEGEQVFAKSAVALRSSPPHSHGQLVLGKVLVRQGSLNYSLAHYSQARLLLDESLEILQYFSADSDRAISLLRIGMILLQVDNLPMEAKDYFQRSLALLDENHQFESCEVLLWLGQVYQSIQDFQKAEQFFQQSLTRGKQLNSIWTTAPINGHLCLFYSRLKAYSDAEYYGQESLKQFTTLGVVWGIGLAHRSLGRVTYLQGRYREAEEHALQALVIDSEHHMAVHTLFTLLLVARLWAAQGRTEVAVELMTLQIPNSQRFDYEEQCLQVLAELESLISADKFAAAVERGKARVWATTIQEVIADLHKNVHLVDTLPAFLTDREVEVLRLVAAGRSNREIAHELVLAVGTVKWYVSDIFSKLGVANRTQAAARARELNLVS
ncbi:MAG: LuxR C-terminal-related transcriptional regulator [Anaerolineae bacterium]